MKVLILALLCAVMAFSNSAHAETSYFSKYTSLKKDCILLAINIEEGYYECPAFGGYELSINEGDFTLKDPKNTHHFQVHDNYYDGFTVFYVGPNLEWRFLKKRKGYHEETELRALIIEVIAEKQKQASDAGPASKTISTFHIVKLSPEKVCLVAEVPPKNNENQNEIARKISDSARGKKCIKR